MIFNVYAASGPQESDLRQIGQGAQVGASTRAKASVMANALYDTYLKPGEWIEIRLAGSDDLGENEIYEGAANVQG